jgi:TetR/AcrR family transcriptional regulator
LTASLKHIILLNERSASKGLLVPTAKPAPKTRDADRSKEVILESADNLFAAQGFDATTMQRIAEAAGLARGTPSYFFSSKEKLFQAVLERENEVFIHVVPEALQRAGEASKEILLETLVDVYFDVIVTQPRFFRLLQWTALQHPELISSVEMHRKNFELAEEAVATITRGKLPKAEQQQWVLSIVGMCTFHAFFAPMFQGWLKSSATEKRFLESRRKHLKTLLRSAISSFKENPK